MPGRRLSSCWNLILPVGLVLISASAACPAETDSKPDLSKKQVKVLIEESLTTLAKSKDILRFASVKLPDLIEDKQQFRNIDREIELVRGDVYPAVSAAEKLKNGPQLLREAIRLYGGLRVFEQRLILLGERLGALQNAAAQPLAVQVVDLANRVGRLNLKLQPYVYKLIDAYQSAAPEGKVEAGMEWDSTQIQGP